MGTTKYTNQTVPTAPENGATRVYVDSADKHLKQIDDGGVVTDLTASTGAIQESLVDAKGDIVTATADDTPARLAVGADDYALIADSSASTGLCWCKNQFGGRYNAKIKTGNYTATLDDNLFIFGAAGAATLTMFAANTIPNDETAREMGVFNLGGGDLTVSLAGTDTFNNGISNITVTNGGFARIIGAYPNTGGGWLILTLAPAHVQLRRAATWAATNFSSLTAVPFDTIDEVHDAYRLDGEVTTNPTRVTAKKAGEFKVSCHGNINSTGGGSYSILGYMRKNGTTKIPGTDFAFGNYQTEDTFFALPAIVTTLAQNDYVEVILNQSNLTGQAEDVVLTVEEV